MITDLFLMLSPEKIIVFILVLTRLSGMLISAPFFSTFPIPIQAKAVLLFLVTFIIYPSISTASLQLSTVTDLPTLMILMLKELSVGAIIGFTAGLIFVAIQMAGQMLSIQMGLAVSSVLDPFTQQQVPVLGQFYQYLASIIFIFVNGHLWLFSSVYDSYHMIPLGYEFIFNGMLVERVLFFTSQLFVIAFGIIMPIYGVLFITDIILGFMSKAMPQMNVFMVALPFKIMVGIWLLIIFMSSTARYLTELILTLLKEIDKIFI